MLIFCSIGTTGYEKKDAICAVGLIAFKADSYLQHAYDRINEGKKIAAEASAIHAITNEMIIDAPAFLQSTTGCFLAQHNSEENILVAHNATALLEMFQRSGLHWHGEVIDTMRLTKHLIEDVLKYDLAYLRYELRLYHHEAALKELCGIKDAFCLHHALGDALYIRLLYAYHAQSIDTKEMLLLSHKRVLLTKFLFGKYVGRYIEEIAQLNRDYLVWMQNLEDLDEDLHYSLGYYLEQNY